MHIGKCVLSLALCVCVSVMLIKCDKYSLSVSESNLEAEGVITLTASNATIFFIVGVVDQPSKGSDLPVTLRQ